MRQRLLSRAWIAGYVLFVIAILAVPLVVDDPYLLN
jgi:hypothetical protein